MGIAPVPAIAQQPNDDDELPGEDFWGLDLRRAFSEQLIAKKCMRRSVRILHKNVTATDVNTNQSRLQLPMNDVNNSMLRLVVPEVGALANYWENPASAPGSSKPPVVNLKAKVLNSRGQEYGMAFRYLSSSKTYRIMGGWNAFVKENNVRPHQILELWWFDVRELGDGAADYDVGFGILNFDRFTPVEKDVVESLLMLPGASVSNDS